MATDAASSDRSVELATVLANARDLGIEASIVVGPPLIGIGRVVRWTSVGTDVTGGDLVVPDWTATLRSRGKVDDLVAMLALAGAAGIVAPAGRLVRDAGDRLAVVEVAPGNANGTDAGDLTQHRVANLLAQAHSTAVLQRENHRTSMLDSALVALAASSDVKDLVQAIGSSLGMPLVAVDRNGAVVAANDPATAMENLAVGGHVEADGRVRVAGEVVASVAVPIVRAGQQLGVMYAFPGTQSNDWCRASLSTVAPLIALAMRAGDGLGTDRHLARELVLDIIGEDMTAREQAVRRAGRLGMLANPPYRVVDMHPVDQRMGPAGPQRLAARLEPEVLAHDSRAVVVAHEGAVVAVVAASVVPDELVRALRRRTPIPLSFGTGSPVKEIRRLPTALRQARRAAQLGTRMPKPGGLTRYEELGAFRLLYLLPEHERRTFVNETLGELANDDSDASELRRTLRTLFEENLNVAKAARRLFVHYNTLRYRITRLVQIVGPFVDDPDRRLTLQVALALHRIAEPTTSPAP